MKEKLLIALFISGIIFPARIIAQSQNTGIGTISPDASAQLDVTSTNKGILIPRVALTATNAAAPVTTPATSLMVWNTATAGTAPNNVTPGFYYWDGAAWARLVAASGLNIYNSDGTLTGNRTVTMGANSLSFNATTGNITFMPSGSGRMGVGTTTPDASAQLDVASTNKGILIPRVALTGTNSASPVTSPVTSLLVYNTATAGAAPNAVTPGFYYWNGATWKPTLTTIGTGWLLAGNAGTNAATDFLGTTDDQPVIVKANNTQVIKFYPNHNIEGGAANSAGSLGTTLLYNTILNGGNNTIVPTSGTVGVHSSIVGGISNWIRASYCFVGGGTNNVVDSTYSSVVGGLANGNAGKYSTIGGGQSNSIQGLSDYSVIGGGVSNTMYPLGAQLPTYSVISGGVGNTLRARITNINGGQNNLIDSTFSTISGGFGNIIHGAYSIIASGYYNTIATSTLAAVIAGGSGNTVNGTFGIISGGATNTNSGAMSAISGGEANNITSVADHANIAGGLSNATGGSFSTISGGSNNYNGSGATGAVISGGTNNYNGAGAIGAVIGGGQYNYNLQPHSVISGGMYDTIDGGAYNAICGGYNNNVRGGLSSTVAGGSNNVIYGGYNFISGQGGNVIVGVGSSIYGGSHDSVITNHAVAIGSYVTVEHNGAMALGDDNANRLHTSAGNQLSARFAGGYRFFTNNAMSTGAYLNGGSSTWVTTSDARLKEHVAPISYGLSTIMSLQPKTYNFIDQTRVCLGFLAQDVQKVMPEIIETQSNGYLSMSYTELIPVLTKAIQEQQTVIEAQQKTIEDLVKRVEDLENK